MKKEYLLKFIFSILTKCLCYKRPKRSGCPWRFILYLIHISAQKLQGTILNCSHFPKQFNDYNEFTEAMICLCAYKIQVKRVVNKIPRVPCSRYQLPKPKPCPLIPQIVSHSWTHSCLINPKIDLTNKDLAFQLLQSINGQTHVPIIKLTGHMCYSSR